MGGAIHTSEGTDLSLKQGGAQLDYPDEDRRIHDRFEGSSGAQAPSAA